MNKYSTASPVTGTSISFAKSTGPPSIPRLYTEYPKVDKYEVSFQKKKKKKKNDKLIIERD